MQFMPTLINSTLKLLSINMSLIIAKLKLTNSYQLVFILLLNAVIFAGVLIPLLQFSLVAHLFIVIPVLILFGYLLGRFFINEPRVIKQWNQSGIPLLVLASLVFIFWMIPRFLDASITDSFYYTLKIISLPILCGVPLAWSLPKASYITYNFFRIEFIATLFRMTWLFLTAKERLCLNYLYSEQEVVGKLFFICAIAFSLWPAIRVVFGQYHESKP